MIPERKIRVAVVDDDQLARAGFISLLSPYKDILVVLEANSGYEILEKLKFTKVDVIMMDISMKDLNGIDATRNIRLKDQDVKILMLSMREEPSFVTNSIEAQANGYLLKKSKVEEIYQAIITVLSEDYFISEFAKDVLSKQMVSRRKMEVIEPDPTQLVEFNKRELQILNLLQQEKSSLEISQVLGCSKSSIDAYRASMMRKTGTHTSTGLVVYSIKNGILK